MQNVMLHINAHHTYHTIHTLTLQATMFRHSAEPLLDSLFEGCNTRCWPPQTQGAGKTYTMGGAAIDHSSDLLGAGVILAVAYSCLSASRYVCVTWHGYVVVYRA